MIIVEYCRFGNLQNYLMKNRNNFVNQVDEFSNMKTDITTVDETDDGPVIQQETAMSSVYCLQDSNRCLAPKSDTVRIIFTKDLISWSFQIARGMGYLSRKKVWKCHFYKHVGATK